MHLQPVHFERMNFEQIAFIEWVNVSLTIHGKLIATLQQRVEAIGKNEPNIRDNPGGEVEVIDPTVLELIAELRKANERREKLRYHLESLIARTRDLLSEIDVEPDRGIQVAAGIEKFVPKLIELNNALFLAGKFLQGV